MGRPKKVVAAAPPAGEIPTPIKGPTDKPGLLTCFGVYKVPGGLWRLRRVLLENDKVVQIQDNEPDLLEIQMGKLDSFMEGVAETL